MSRTPIDHFLSQGGRISSRYGMRRDPFTGEQAMHHGIDITHPDGERHVWTAPCQMTVVRTGLHDGAGNFVAARLDGTNLLALFFHLKEVRVKASNKLVKGSPVGVNGRTGRATGPHLHFEIRHERAGYTFGSPVWGDPEKYYIEEGTMSRKTYTVVRGDTLAAIALRFSVTVHQLRIWNNRTPEQDRSLAIGTVLFVEPEQLSEVEKLRAEAKQLRSEVNLLQEQVKSLQGKINKAQDALK